MSLTSKSTGKWLQAILVIVSLTVLVLSLNAIVGRMTWRADATENKIYTLSEGTESILENVREAKRPVAIRLYASAKAAQLSKEQESYARKVEQLLSEYRKASDGLITVERLDPTPTSPEEDSAKLDNIQQRDSLMDRKAGPQSLDDIDYNRGKGSTNSYYFGLSISSLQNKESIAYLDPEKETTLEYELSRAIAAVTREKKPLIGVLFAPHLSVDGSPSAIGQRGGRPWSFYETLSKDFEMENVPFDIGYEPPSNKGHVFNRIDMLIVVHPVNVQFPQPPMRPGVPPMGPQVTTVNALSNDTLYAIDQYLLNGGNILAFVDPVFMVDRYFDVFSSPLPVYSPASLRKEFADKKMPTFSSIPRTLFSKYGIEMNPMEVFLDPKYTRNVAYQRNPQAVLQQPMDMQNPESSLLNKLRALNNPNVADAILQSLITVPAVATKFSADSLSSNNSITSGLESVFMMDAGAFKTKPPKGVRKTPLITTSAETMKADILPLVESLTKQQPPATNSAGRLDVAVLLEGKFPTAFPEGNPVLVEAERLKKEEEERKKREAEVAEKAAEEAKKKEEEEARKAQKEEAEKKVLEEKAKADQPATDGESNPAEAGEGKPAVDGEPKSAESGENGAESEQGGCQASEGDESAVGDGATPSDIKPVDAEGEEDSYNVDKDTNHLANGAREGKLVVIADVDMIHPFFLGNAAAGNNRDNNNLALVQNTVEKFTSNADLSSIRTRGSTNRPFTLFNEVRAEAAKRSKPKLDKIKSEIASAEGAMRDIQVAITQEGEIVQLMSPEQQQALADAQNNVARLLQDKREIERDEEKEINAKVSSYTWWNLITVPLVVVLAGLLVGISRKISTAAR